MTKYSLARERERDGVRGSVVISRLCCFGSLLPKLIQIESVELVSLTSTGPASAPTSFLRSDSGTEATFTKVLLSDLRNFSK